MQSFLDAFTEALALLLRFDGDLREIILLSLKVSLSAVFFAAVVGLPAGAWLATTQSRVKPFLIAIVSSFMGLPPVVVGLFVYLLLSNAGVFGPLQLLYTPTAMIIAQAILITPILIALTRETLSGLYSHHREQLTLFGIPPFGLIRTLLWEGRHGLMTALLAGFGRAIAEVGAVIIVGFGFGHSPCDSSLAHQHGCSRTRRVFCPPWRCCFMSTVLPVTGTGLYIERGERAVLNISSIELGRQECTAIVGPNGAGKSLLVKTLCHLTVPDSGTVLWSGKIPDLHSRFKVGLLLQRPVLLQRTALENLIFALRASGHRRSDALFMAGQALEQAGLSELVDVLAHRLSGGEQQRLALARALVVKPDMLFLDEATANVDPASTSAIEQQLRSAIGDGLRVVLVSHDMGQVKRLATEVLLLHRGELVEQVDSSTFFEHTDNPISRSWVAGELLL